MGGLRKQVGGSVPVLKREATPPVPSAMRRPCSLIGAALALVFLAAMLDAALWHYSYDRQQLRGEVRAAEITIEHLEQENLELKLQLLNRDLQDLDRASNILEEWRHRLIADDLKAVSLPAPPPVD